MRNVMLITGASRGIGAATALLAAERGYAVVLNYLRNREAAEALRQRIERQGGEALAVAADVAEEGDVERLFAAIDERFGRLDALVNNAGVLEAQTGIRDQRDRQLPLRPRGGEAPVDPPRRARRQHR